MSEADFISADNTMRELLKQESLNSNYSGIPRSNSLGRDYPVNTNTNQPPSQLNNAQAGIYPAPSSVAQNYGPTGGQTVTYAANQTQPQLQTQFLGQQNAFNRPQAQPTIQNQTPAQQNLPFQTYPNQNNQFLSLNPQTGSIAGASTQTYYNTRLPGRAALPNPQFQSPLPTIA